MRGAAAGPALLAGALRRRRCASQESSIRRRTASRWRIRNGFLPIPTPAWKAFVHDVGKWWPADHSWWGDASKLSISEKVGGCFCEINGAQQAWHMTVTFVDPGKTDAHDRRPGSAAGHGPRMARWNGVSSEEKGGTRITLWYRAGGYTPDDLSKFVPVIDKVQGLQLGGLAEYLRKQGSTKP